MSTRRASGLPTAVLLMAWSATLTAAEPAVTYDFTTDVVGRPPPAFESTATRGGHPGTWVVRVQEGAPSAPQVLVQEDPAGDDGRFALAVAKAPRLLDGTVTMRGRPMGGVIDQAIGLAVRYQDQDNYLLVRANALEDNVNLYVVKDGRRREISGWSGKVASGTWHALGITLAGKAVTVEYDGQPIIHATVDGWDLPGRVAFWTKADSVSAFDDLVITPSSPAPTR